jgi:hypothetical protein
MKDLQINIFFHHRVTESIPDQSPGQATAIMTSAWGGLWKHSPWTYSKRVSVFVPKEYFRDLPVTHKRESNL